MEEKYSIPDVDEEKYDPQKIQEKELMDFSRKNKISGDELELAYKLAMGVAEEKERAREEVIALAKKMEEFMKNGLAINRIVEMIGSKREYEAACDNYYNLVSTMPISEREKEVLVSIVKKKRAGKLTITDKKIGKNME